MSNWPRMRGRSVSAAIAILFMLGMQVSAVAATEIATADDAERLLSELARRDQTLPDLYSAAVIRHRTKGRIEFVVERNATRFAAVAGQMPQLAEEDRVFRFLCSTAMVRSLVADELVIDEAVPYRGLVALAAEQLTAASASISDLVVRDSRLVNGWYFAICSAPRSGITVTHIDASDRIGLAAFGVAKALISQGRYDRVDDLLAIAARAKKLGADAAMLRAILLWPPAADHASHLGQLINAMTDVEAMIIVGSFLEAKARWTLAGDAFARCLEIEPNHHFCRAELAQAEAKERVAARAALRDAFGSRSK